MRIMSRKVGKLSDLKWHFRQTLRKLLPREIVSVEVLLISLGDNLLLQVFAALRAGGWVVGCVGGGNYVRQCPAYSEDSLAF